MKHWLTTPKLIIAVLIALTGGFVLHGRSKAQPTLETHADLPEIDRRLITAFEGRPTEPGEPEPPLSGFMQHAQDAFSLLNAENNTERRLVSTLPTQPALLANYPNPFNPETWIPYQLAEPAEVKVSIFAADGTLVRTLALGPQAPGVYESKSRAAYWDGRNAAGERVASGVYFYTLEAGTFTATRKMLIMK